MKAVILAAGYGTRMKELTKNRPKPMLTYQDENLLEHKFKNLPDSIDEVVLIVGYLGNVIRNHFGDNWSGRKVHYVEQKELLGTAHSIWQARGHLNDRFLVLYGDDLYSKEDLEKLIQQQDWAVLVWPETSSNAGSCVIEDSHLIGFIENDPNNKRVASATWTGACLLDGDLFNYEMAPLPGKKEFGLPQTFIRAVPDRKIKVVTANFWKRITSPEDLLIPKIQIPKL